MQNPFSMLSQVMDRFRQTDDEQILALREGLASTELEIKNLKRQLLEAQTDISILASKVKEMTAVNEIILAIQQNLLEEITYGPAQQQKAKVVPIFSLGGNDDDDLPN